MPQVYNKKANAGQCKTREVSKIIEAGGVAAAVESVSGKIYVGVCVDTACTLDICAERNAIFNMLTNGEDALKRVIAINRDGKSIPPCGACREFMTQLMPETYRNNDGLRKWENNDTWRPDTGMVDMRALQIGSFGEKE